MSLLVPVPNSSCPLHQDDWGLGEMPKADLKNSIIFLKKEKNIILFQGILLDGHLVFSKGENILIFKMQIVCCINNATLPDI